MSSSNYNDDPKIYIIPDFKELSRNPESFNQHTKSCGFTGQTTENCLGDYDEDNKKMIRRANYHKNTDKSPNHFLHKDHTHFEIVENTQGFTIKKYMDNWKLLFQIINKIIDEQPQSGGILNKITNFFTKNTNKTDLSSQSPPSVTSSSPPISAPSAPSIPSSSISPIKKYNVFISGHQHLFQKMFFNFKKYEGPRYHEFCKQVIDGYGFRNCTCIKISKKNDDLVEIKVVYSNNSGRDKFKYKYIDEGEILTTYLVENTYPTNDINGLLNKCDIYMIRHGEAIHNLKDIIKTREIKKGCDEKGSENIKVTQGDEEIINKLKENKSLYKINAQLTTQGLIQANDLYNALYVGYNNSFMDKKPPIINENNKNIYISSPMDRTIETLIYATSGKSTNKFDDLKQKNMKMRLDMFPITHKELTTIGFTGYSNKGFADRETFPNSEEGGLGGRRKTRRKINKRSRRKTKKVKKTRKTKKRYQKGFAKK